ncbi:hypothetical protein HNQ91_000082 [Filimonas zeae]|uniref:DUF4261 domain-containing protein n=1 Tax=Filimonas zeae TaxID=1737353 RepID=A0A917IM96_9BACT|nr:DUF4261 domain-containing protein [Filimonas zeae]MDR6337060.1 hypothetical protein [Filimonas zeae]GGH56814.1 hypothetical protein GCM10011379_00810 [Filimonas zeae]
MLTGMILLKGRAAMNADRFAKDFAQYSDADMEELVKDGSTLLLNIEGAAVAISTVTQPIAPGDIQTAAKRAYEWPAVLNDVKGHQSHLVVAVSENKTDDVLKHFVILTDVLCALLRTTEAVGVYMPSQQLLIAKEVYLDEAEDMDEDYFPLNLWMYFAVQAGDKGVSGYTNGLKDFGKAELEIVDSVADGQDVRAFLFNMAHYIIENDVVFEDGDTCGVTEEEDVVVKCSPGVKVKGTTCKLLYRQ